MRFIGGKTLLLENIRQVIEENTQNVQSIADVFSGSGVVSAYFRNKYKVYSNDNMYFSYVLARGNNNADFGKLTDYLGQHPVDYLNSLKLETAGVKLEDCFVYQNYSKHDNCERMYFTPENAVRIDIIRLTIENWKEKNLVDEDGYFALLALLLQAVPYVSNITGTYGAYLKHWDKRSLNRIVLEYKPYADLQPSKAYNLDCYDFAREIFTQKVDLAYFDPPYNQRQYLPNYHILETIARYDYPEIRGVTGMRDYKNQRSVFCQKNGLAESFRLLMDRINVRYIVFSYNNEGLISTEELTEIFKSVGIAETFKLYEFDYRRYKSKIPNNKKGLKEQIYFIEKIPRKKMFYKSPMNYIGGKYKLLPQLAKLFPKNINTFVDIFAGGLDVSLNVNAKKIICNDINMYVMQIYQYFQNTDIHLLLKQIDATIEKWQLSMQNKENYLLFRQYYNKTRNPLDLFVLMCYSFNYQFRFNGRHEYNNPFGKERSSFNEVMRENLIAMHKRIGGFEFHSKNFKDFDYDVLKKGDFLYADPPYLIACGSYNDGKRGFEGWGEKEENALYEVLESLDRRGVFFALSNVIEHKGERNTRLINWAEQYNMHLLVKNYNNSNYQSTSRNNVTREVLITNY